MSKRIVIITTLLSLTISCGIQSNSDHRGSYIFSSAAETVDTGRYPIDHLIIVDEDGQSGLTLIYLFNVHTDLVNLRLRDPLAAWPPISRLDERPSASGAEVWNVTLPWASETASSCNLMCRKPLSDTLRRSSGMISGEASKECTCPVVPTKPAAKRVKYPTLAPASMTPSPRRRTARKIRLVAISYWP